MLPDDRMFYRTGVMKRQYKGVTVNRCLTGPECPLKVLKAEEQQTQIQKTIQKTGNLLTKENTN